MIYIVLNKFADALTEEWRINVKKIVCILLVLLMFGSTCVFAANVPIIASYTAAFSEKQGVNCFYFCENKSGQVKELVYNIEANGNKRWISESGGYPMLSGNYATPSLSLIHILLSSCTLSVLGSTVQILLCDFGFSF